MKLALISVTRYGGWLALSLLLCALCATPLARVLARVRPGDALRIPKIRRALGISAACAALGHALFSLTVIDVSLSLLWSWPHLRAGLLAAAVLCALVITSFPAAVRRLHLHAWKELHRLAYIAALLALAHVLLAPFSSHRLVLTLFACTLLFGLARFLPNKTKR